MSVSNVRFATRVSVDNAVRQSRTTASIGSTGNGQTHTRNGQTDTKNDQADGRPIAALFSVRSRFRWPIDRFVREVASSFR